MQKPQRSIRHHPEPKGASATSVAVRERVKALIIDVDLPRAAELGGRLFDDRFQPVADCWPASWRYVISNTNVKAALIAEPVTGRIDVHQLLEIFDGQKRL